MTMAPRPVALITGAGRRLGRSLALDLARSGWAIGVHYRRSRGEAEDVVAEITAAGGRAAALAADLAIAEEVARLVPLCL